MSSHSQESVPEEEQYRLFVLGMETVDCMVWKLLVKLESRAVFEE